MAHLRFGPYGHDVGGAPGSVISHSHRIQTVLQVRVPVAYPPSTTEHPPSISLSSISISPLFYTIKCPIPTQEVGNALVIPPESRVSMGGGDHLYFGGSHAR
ncbi:hypothetical protein EVAR_57195_1 [Eumeta japonica]|uniref:Uncharacterized protein n=1 Tax=Eumeta variegata TaxID=151549 RepID=A0A4C1Z106_EUMVA|nr:hypothetical protein EVAR_57195_1 [Eumeta japonica]